MKRALSTLSQKIQSVPKVELHRHLEGSVRLTTVLEEAIKHNVSLPHGSNGEMTLSSNLTLEGIRPHIQSIKPFPNLETLLEIFNHTQSTFVKLDVFYRIAKEAVLDAHEEGIRCLELRYAPSFASMPPNDHHSFQDVLQAIQDGIKDAQTTLGGDDSIGVGILCIGVGAMGPGAMNATTEFYLNNQDAFVGFDMAGAEQNVLEHQACFQRVHDAGGRITCHASEDVEMGSPENALNAVTLLKAERIGHGIQTIKDTKVMDVLRDRSILLEVSVTSNWLTGAVPTIESHPAKKLWEHGILLCPNSDDPGIMGIDANHEWSIWTEKLGFGADDMTAMTIHALDRSFISDDVKKRIFDLHFSTLVPEVRNDTTQSFEASLAWAHAHHRSQMKT